MQQTDFGDTTQLILLIIGLILTALVLYLAVRIIAGKKNLDGGYFIKLFLVALIIYVAVIAISAIVGLLPNEIGAAFAQAIPILVFTAAIYIIDILLVESKDKDKSVLIALITFIFLYVLEYIVSQLLPGYNIIPIV